MRDPILITDARASRPQLLSSSSRQSQCSWAWQVQPTRAHCKSTCRGGAAAAAAKTDREPLYLLTEMLTPQAISQHHIVAFMGSHS